MARQIELMLAISLCVGGIAVGCANSVRAADCGRVQRTFWIKKSQGDWAAALADSQSLRECAGNDLPAKSVERWIQDLSRIQNLSLPRQSHLRRSEALGRRCWAAILAGDLVRAQVYLAEREALWSDIPNALRYQDAILNRLWLAELTREVGDYRAAEFYSRGMLEVVTRVFGPSDGIVSVVHTLLGRIALDLGSDRWSEIEGHFRAALEGQRSEHAEDSRSVVLATRDLAFLFLAREDFGAAEKLLRRVSELSAQRYSKHSKEFAVTLMDLGACAIRRGDPRQAEVYFRRELSLLRSLGSSDDREIVRASQDLTRVLIRESRMAEALELHGEAFAIAERPATVLTAQQQRMVVGDQAELLALTGNSRDAEKLIVSEMRRLAVAVGRRSDEIATANALDRWAQITAISGRWSEAEDALNESRMVRARLRGPQDPTLLRYDEDLAELQLRRGILDRSPPRRYDLHDRVLVREGSRSSTDVVMDWVGSGLRSNVVRPDTIATGMPSTLEIGQLSRSEFERNLHRFRSVLPEGGLHRFGGLGDSAFSLMGADSLRAKIDLGQAMLQQGNAAGAERVLTRVLPAIRRLFGDYHRSVLRVLTLIAEAHRAQGELRASREILVEACRSFEVLRHLVSPGIARTTFASSPYKSLAWVELKLEHFEAAWNALDRARGRSLESAWDNSLRGDGDTDQSVRLLRELSYELTRTSAISAERADLRSRIDAEARRFLRLTLGDPEEPSLGMSDGNAVVLTWVEFEPSGAEHQLWLAIRAGEQIPRFHLVASGNAAVRRIERSRLGFLGVIRDRGSSVHEVADAAKELRRLLLPSDLDALAAVDRWIVIPEGPVLGVPVDALFAHGTGSMGNVDVSYAPSVELSRGMQRSESLKIAPKALIVADPPFSPEAARLMREEIVGEHARNSRLTAASRGARLTRGFLRRALAGDRDALHSLPRLGWSYEESEWILPSVAPNSLVLREVDASEDKIRRLADSGELAEFRVLHFATHALVDTDHAGIAALVLSQEEIDSPSTQLVEKGFIADGLITADEIAHTWDLDADLVVLSACETGIGKELPGEGYVGLAHAFLTAGSRQVLVSLWQVDDEATALFMKRFYELRFGQGVESSAALRGAQTYVRQFTRGGNTDYRPFEHPYYWRAFVLIGRV